MSAAHRRSKRSAKNPLVGEFVARPETTGTVPPQIAKHLADALQVDEAIVAAVMAATARQQQDEASQRTLAREAAYRTAFKPHLRCETERAIPEPLFVAALLTSASAAAGAGMP
jgi:hypothetical protein